MTVAGNESVGEGRAAPTRRGRERDGVGAGTVAPDQGSGGSLQRLADDDDVTVYVTDANDTVIELVQVGWAHPSRVPKVIHTHNRIPSGLPIHDDCYRVFRMRYDESRPWGVDVLTDADIPEGK